MHSQFHDVSRNNPQCSAAADKMADTIIQAVETAIDDLGDGSEGEEVCLFVEPMRLPEPCSGTTGAHRSFQVLNVIFLASEGSQGSESIRASGKLDQATAKILEAIADMGIAQVFTPLVPDLRRCGTPDFTGIPEAPGLMSDGCEEAGDPDRRFDPAFKHRVIEAFKENGRAFLRSRNS